MFGKILESNSDRVGVYFEVSDYYRDRANAEKMGEAVAKAERIDPDDRRLKFYKGRSPGDGRKKSQRSGNAVEVLSGHGSRKFRSSAACGRAGMARANCTNPRDDFPKRRKNTGCRFRWIRTTRQWKRN